MPIFKAKHISYSCKKSLFKPSRKVLCLFGMLVVALVYSPAYKLALFVTPSFTRILRLYSLPDWLGYIPAAFVLSMSHELLHALAWWYFGYSAKPIPLLIPPILGITIGDKPRRWHENFIISLAPLLLTLVCFLNFYITGDSLSLYFGLINLFGMSYDFIHAFIG